MKGLTIWVCFGKFARPHIKIMKDGFIFRLCLGRISFSIYKYDVEKVLEMTVDTIYKQKNIIDKENNEKQK